MDKKKKIIAFAVFGVFVIVVGYFAKTVLFGNDEIGKEKFTLFTPDVIESQIDSISKKNGYDEEKIINNWDDTNLLGDPEDEKNKEVGAINLFQREQQQADSLEQLRLLEESFGQQVDPELLALMQMQEEIAASQATAYSNYAQPSPAKQVEPVKELTLKDIRAANEKTNFFNGASEMGYADNISLNLVPAETIDQGILIVGSTVAIRTKQPVHIVDIDLIIPKGAVLYGKSSFGAIDRLMIDIVSYKVNDKLTPIDLNIYDFDGREGIHLGNKSWPKIPPKIAKDVFNYVKQKGTQASTFGGGSRVDLNEAKDVATVSALKEITSEIFEKKRVFMPRKYNVWIHTNIKKEQR